MRTEQISVRSAHLCVAEYSSFSVLVEACGRGNEDRSVGPARLVFGLCTRYMHPLE